MTIYAHVVMLSYLQEESRDILGTYLFIKVPRPGDSEGTFSVFESSYQSAFP